MKVSQEKVHYNWLIIGVLTATLWLTVSANYYDYPTECPKHDPLNYTVLLPHETDCDKYYACSNGRKILMHCPIMDNEGNRLYFSQKYHVCVFPEQSDCKPQSTTTEQTSTSTESTTTTSSSTTTTKKPITTTEPPTTATEPSTTTEPPATTTEPPATTTEPPTTTTESTTAPEVVSTSNPPTTTIVTSTAEQSTPSSGISTNEPSITTTELPNPSTEITTNNPPTTTEISSTTGQSTSSTGSSSSEPPVISTTEQPNSLTGSTSSEARITSTTVQSTSSIEVSTHEPLRTETSTTSTTLPVCTKNTREVYFAHESYSHLYYECKNGDLIRRECDKNSNFDVIVQMCVESLNTNYSEELSEASRTNSSKIPSLCNSDASNNSCGRHPHECDCHKFYICINGNAILRICPSSLSFNPTLNECDLSENVKCSGDNGGNSNGNTSTTLIPTQCPPDNTGWAIQLPHETNCSLFYKCNWGKKIVLPCRPGLHFNPRLQVCDWPCAAGCTAEGGDGSNTCNSHNHPDSEMPTEEKPLLRFNMLKTFAPIKSNDDANRRLDD